MNPPYGHGVAQWIRKAYTSSLAGATVVCLVKATPDTRWWHAYTPHAEVRFVPGRVRFVGAQYPAPFPVCVVIFRPHAVAGEPSGSVQAIMASHTIAPPYGDTVPLAQERIMSLSTRPNEIVLTVRITPATLADTLRLLATTLTPRGHPTAPEPDAGDAEEDDPAPVPVPEPNPPPVATRQQPPVPAVQGAASRAGLPPGTMLGELCRRKHRYEGRRKSLRRQSNGKCLMCLQQHERARKPARPVPHTPVLRETQGPKRPELPPHLALTTFLSPIVCAEPSHRYRGLEAWTLRYSADETCVQCVTQQSALQLAGD
jgi:hypothetical protein